MGLLLDLAEHAFDNLLSLPQLLIGLKLSDLDQFTLTIATQKMIGITLSLPFAQISFMPYKELHDQIRNKTRSSIVNGRIWKRNCVFCKNVILIHAGIRYTHPLVSMLPCCCNLIHNRCIKRAFPQQMFAHSRCPKCHSNYFEGMHDSSYDNLGVTIDRHLEIDANCIPRIVKVNFNHPNIVTILENFNKFINDIPTCCISMPWAS